MHQKNDFLCLPFESKIIRYFRCHMKAFIALIRYNYGFCILLFEERDTIGYFRCTTCPFRCHIIAFNSYDRWIHTDSENIGFHDTYTLASGWPNVTSIWVERWWTRVMSKNVLSFFFLNFIERYQDLVDTYSASTYQIIHYGLEV